VDQYNPRFALCVQALRRHADDVERAATVEMAEREKANTNALQLAAAGLVVTLLALVLGAWRFQRAISRPLADTASRLDQAADALAQFAEEVSQSSQILAEGANSQAAALQETSASLEEISSMTQRNADSAGRAKGSASRTRQVADAGTTDMEALTHAMEAVKEASSNIGKIVKTIDEIAFQTNILALNAAVEAARAGEAGAGFAVVADEVRNLAQRSTTAARETSEQIADALQRANRGVDICGLVATGFEDIRGKINQLTSLATEIATASEQQTQGIGQINTAVVQMDQVTQGNASQSEEAAAAAEELSAQASQLESIAGQLKTLVEGSTASKNTRPAKTGPASGAPSSQAKLHAHGVAESEAELVER
jgi:methyl-accepting chemotaxis protein